MTQAFKYYAGSNLFNFVFSEEIEIMKWKFLFIF